MTVRSIKDKKKDPWYRSREGHILISIPCTSLNFWLFLCSVIFIFIFWNIISFHVALVPWPHSLNAAFVLWISFFLDFFLTSICLPSLYCFASSKMRHRGGKERSKNLIPHPYLAFSGSSRLHFEAKQKKFIVISVRARKRNKNLLSTFERKGEPFNCLFFTFINTLQISLS